MRHARPTIVCLLGLFAAPLASAAWTIENPPAAEPAAASDVAYGNATSEDFRAAAGANTFNFDGDAGYTQDAAPQDNHKTNPGRLILTNYFKADDGLRLDITAAGAGNFTVRSGGPGYTSSGDTAIISNQSRLDINIRRRENAEDRTLQAVGFTLNHFGAPAGQVIFFSDDFTTPLHTINLEPSPTGTIFIGYDAGSPTISAVRITTHDADGNPVSEQYGLDDLSLSLGPVASESTPE